MSEQAVPWVRPKYLVEDTDRHGNLRLYVRRPGAKKIRIRPEPGTDAFWAAYTSALIGVSVDVPAKPTRPAPAAPGSFRWLCERYFEAPEYLRNLDVSTRSARRNVLDSCCLEPTEPGGELLMAGCPIGKFTSRHARMLCDRKAEAPEAANRRLKTLRVLFKWALANEDIVRRFPFAGDVPPLRTNSGGFHTWTVDEVERFERAHAEGSTARLALALLMFTGQRKSDVIALGRQHVVSEVDPATGATSSWLHFTQHKNRNRKAVTLDLPILPELATALGGAARSSLTLLVNDLGRPFTVAGFGNRMRKWCDAAGLKHCSAHGLRKAGACVAAENGATEAQLMAIFGGRTPTWPRSTPERLGKSAWPATRCTCSCRGARQSVADRRTRSLPSRRLERRAIKLSHFLAR